MNATTANKQMSFVEKPRRPVMTVLPGSACRAREVFVLRWLLGRTGVMGRLKTAMN